MRVRPAGCCARAPGRAATTPSRSRTDRGQTSAARDRASSQNGPGRCAPSASATRTPTSAQAAARRTGDALAALDHGDPAHGEAEQQRRQQPAPEEMREIGHVISPRNRCGGSAPCLRRYRCRRPAASCRSRRGEAVGRQAAAHQIIGHRLRALFGKRLVLVPSPSASVWPAISILAVGQRSAVSVRRSSRPTESGDRSAPARIQSGCAPWPADRRTIAGRRVARPARKAA